MERLDSSFSSKLCLHEACARRAANTLFVRDAPLQDETTPKGFYTMGAGMNTRLTPQQLLM